MRIRSFVSSAAIVGILLTGTALVSYAADTAEVSSGDQQGEVRNDAGTQSVEQLRQQLDQLKSSLSEVVKLAEALKTDNEKKAGFIAELQEENEALAEKLHAASQGSQSEAKKAEMREEVNSAPVRSVVLGDVAATTAAEPSRNVMQKVKTPETQPEPTARTAAETSPAKAVPLPPTKPAAPVVSKADAEPAAQPETEQNVAESTAAVSPPDENIRKIDAAMAVIEEEMRNLDPSETDEMQRLGRQYAYLKSQRSYLTQEMDDVAQNEAIETAEAMPEPEELPSEDLLQAETVNEAQAYEASLKARKDAVAVVEQPAPEPQPEPEPEPISVSQSADPFAEMSVENEEGEVLAEAPPQEPVTEIELDTMEPASAESVQEVAPSAAALPEEGASIEALIAAARVTSPDRIKRVEKASDSYDIAYQWAGDSIYGSAEQKKLSSPAEFDALVQTYLERTQSRCPGEFAVVPDGSIGGGELRADSYDVACVGKNVSSGASLLFFNQGGTFTVVAHEAPAEALDRAITMRNQVRNMVIGG